MSGPTPNCPRQIMGYHLDDEGHWVAQLSCGHNQHVRHDPPWVHRQWVLSQSGRDRMLGFELNCVKCVDNAPADSRPTPVKATR
jgi:Protein of unknown function (DUF3565)